MLGNEKFETRPQRVRRDGRGDLIKGVERLHFSEQQTHVSKVGRDVVVGTPYLPKRSTLNSNWNGCNELANTREHVKAPGACLCRNSAADNDIGLLPTTSSSSAESNSMKAESRRAKDRRR